MISASYRHYVEEELLPQCGQLIRSQLPQSDMDELTRIIESFGNFAIELWSQNTRLTCVYLESFEDKVYHHADKHMEIARAVGIDESDTKLDGRPIPVVVQPLILGYGTHDGKDYEKYKVWSKAVVWVRKNEEPATTVASRTNMTQQVLRLTSMK